MLHLIAVCVSALVFESVLPFALVAAASFVPLSSAAHPFVLSAVAWLPPSLRPDAELFAGLLGLSVLVACLLAPPARSAAHGWKRTPASTAIAKAAKEVLAASN